MNSLPARAAPAALTFAVAALGGAIFFLIGLPAPWLSGSTLAVGMLALARRGGDLPVLLVSLSMVLLGASMGAAVTPDALSQAMKWPGSLLGLALSVVVIVGLSALFLNKVAGWDRATALYASIPGVLPVVLMMAAESNANIPRVVITQVLRVFVLVAFIPALVTSVGVEQVIAIPPPGTAIEFLLLALLCPIGGYLAQRLRIPVGMLLGSFVVSAALHMSELAVAPLPESVIIFAFLVLGVTVGRRFANVELRELPGVLVPAFGAFAVATGAAIAAAAIVARLLDMPLEQVFLAYVPGALETMIVMAFALGVDPVYVAIHQLVRFIGLALTLPFLFSPRKGKAAD